MSTAKTPDCVIDFKEYGLGADVSADVKDDILKAIARESDYR